MKNILFALAIVFAVSISVMAQTPPHPNGGNAPGSGNTPVGGGAPIDGGIIILLAMAAGYQSKKYLSNKN
ncbi:MAG: hypothetical protein K8R53_04630 [Bacteroidales bacterium]|nr:hypothetical protein [Bacteroidales bacterium]